MLINQTQLTTPPTAAGVAVFKVIEPNLILAFGNVRFFADGSLGKFLRAQFPNCLVIGCSTAGEIVGGAVYHDTLVLTAVRFGQDELTLACETIADASTSRATGEHLGQTLRDQGAEAVFVLAPGLNINGSDMVAGMTAVLGDQIPVTGGLAGDDAKFEKTYTLFNDNITTDTVVALGLKGQAAQLAYGSQGGWKPFGPERRVTRASGNILYELDGKSALQLYKEYLGDKAKDLPASGLYYPFVVRSDSAGHAGVIRTILNIDEQAGSLILAGNMPTGAVVQLMHAKTEGLIGGAANACHEATAQLRQLDATAQLGILISCVGRKLVMGDDVDEEVGVIRTALGDTAVLTGFYSYGEICPFQGQVKKPHLHNQTMTVTLFGQSV